MNTRSRIALTGRAEAHIAAPPEAVWQVVSDVTRNSEWSCECYKVTWLGQHETAAPGARFRGRNRSGAMRWTRVCEVVAVDAPRQLTWHTVGVLRPVDSTEWQITLEPTAEGTRIVQTYRVLRLARWLDRVYARLNPSHTDRSEELASDLRRLRAVVEATAAHTARP